MLVIVCMEDFDLAQLINTQEKYSGSFVSIRSI